MNQSNCIKFLALGNQINIGTLLNYVEDDILRDIYLWDPEDLPSQEVVKKVRKESVNVHSPMETERTNNCKENDDAMFEYEPWLTHLGMDDHSAMSLMTLPTRSFEGAWQYVTDRVTDSTLRDSEIVIHCYCSSRKVYVDPNKLDIICRPEKLAKTKATHVVVGVTYGQEAFCIFSDKQNKNSHVKTTSDDERLKNHANFFARGLQDGQTLLELDEEGNEEDGGRGLSPTDLDCILYKDTRDGKMGTNWTLKPIDEQYEACRKVLEHQEDESVPLRVLLYPLHKLLPTEASFIKLPDKQIEISRENEIGISHDVVIRCQWMWNHLKRVRLETESLTTELNKLKCHEWIPQKFYQNVQDFSEYFKKFTSALNKGWYEWILSTRRGECSNEKNIIEMIESVKSKSPFVAKEFKHWLKYQKYQIKTFEMLANLSGVCVLSEADQLPSKIKSFGQDQFAVVLHLPSLVGQSDFLIEELISYVKASTKSQPPKWIQWKHTFETMLSSIAVIRRRIFSICPDFSEWVTNHNHDTINVHYLVYYGDQLDSGDGLPFIRVYDCDSGDVVSMNFSIPMAPGEVTVKKNRRGVIRLSWMAEEREDGSFLLQYRNVNKSEEFWKSITHSSNEITINYLQPDESYFFRVATLTEGGRSPFGPISCEVMIDPIYKRPAELQCLSVTDTSITISWNHVITEEEKNEKSFKIVGYQIDCWENDQKESTLIRRSTSDKSIKLEPLCVDITYCIQVRVAFTDSFGSKLLSSPSRPIFQTRTLREAKRAVHIARKVSQMSSVSSGIEIYNLPLKEVRGSKTQGFGHYVFGEKTILSLVGKQRKRTILMLGATGSGKSTLINSLINYVLGIEWTDDFRFKLIVEPDKKSQAHSQTNLVTTYDLYEMKGSRLGYSLTVVDTPGFGDTKGLEKDNEIMEQIKNYFNCSKHGIQQLEAVCFVACSALARLTKTEKYIFDSILSIFGQDIKDNIRLMVTFSDKAEPPVLEAIKEANIPSLVDPTTGTILYHKFNNSGFFDKNEVSQTYFKIAVKSFKKFFDDLSQMETKSLTLTREVLEERKRLDVLVEVLQTTTEIKLTKVDELRQIEKVLKENQEQMEANKNFLFEVEFLVPKATDISGTGQFTTNCQNCARTCHFPCRQASDEDKHLCSVMNSIGRCMICKCPWNKHFNQKYRYEMVKEKIKRSSDAIRKQYQGAEKETITNERLMQNIKKDIDEHEKQLLELTQATHQHIQRLDQIALRPHSFTISDYIDLLIKAEEQKPLSKCNQTISTLQKLRQKSELAKKLVQEQSTFVNQP